MSVWHRPLVWVTRNIREALKGANAPSSENPFATMDDVGGGGSIPDPLELGAAVFDDYVAAGTSLFGGPAQSGAFRVAAGGALSARNFADDADIELIKDAEGVTTISSGGVTAEVSLLPDPDGDAKVRIKADGTFDVKDADGDSIISIETDGTMYMGKPQAARFSPAGSLIIHNSPGEPIDADLNAGDLTFWYDKSNGAAKLMIKAKTANGTVAVGEVALT